MLSCYLSVKLIQNSCEPTQINYWEWNFVHHGWTWLSHWDRRTKTEKEVKVHCFKMFLIHLCMACCCELYTCLHIISPPQSKDLYLPAFLSKYHPNHAAYVHRCWIHSVVYFNLLKQKKKINTYKYTLCNWVTDLYNHTQFKHRCLWYNLVIVQDMVQLGIQFLFCPCDCIWVFKMLLNSWNLVFRMIVVWYVTRFNFETMFTLQVTDSAV